MVCESIWAGVPAEGNVAPDGSAVLLSMYPQKTHRLVLDILKKKIEKIRNSETL